MCDVSYFTYNPRILLGITGERRIKKKNKTVPDRILNGYTNGCNIFNPLFQSMKETNDPFVFKT